MTRIRAALLLAPCLLLGSTAALAREVVTIGSVQGRGAHSARVGQDVTVEGVVGVRFDGPGARVGWFLQDAGDGDATTSDAVFVHDPASTPVVAGERVRVRGRVVEQDLGGASRTALEDPRVLQRLGPGTVTATVVNQLPPDWERLEGMAVHLQAPLWLGERKDTRQGVSFGERPWQPTERAAPGSAQAQAIAQDHRRRRLWLDEGRADADRAAAALWPDGLDRARRDSRLDDVVGVLDQFGGDYGVHLGQRPTLRPGARPHPPRVAGDLRIAALNLENLFNGDGHGSGFPTARGARTAAELAAQLAKHVATLRGLDADLVALMELENDGYGPESSLVALVSALNRDGGGAWRHIDAGHGPGDNPIRVGLIYRDDRVRPQGAPATLTQGPFGPHSRVPLAQAFVPVAGGRDDGAAFVIVANHFKSKGCSGAEGADRNQGDGTACWNATRTDSARRLDAWLQSDPTGSGSDRTLIVGDLNAYAQEAPLRALAEAGWRDAFAVAGIRAPYSYVYDGQLGRLDHALLSPALAANLRGAAEWHSNADEPEAAGYRAGGTGPWRSADHDPLLLGFALRRGH
ncbi:ExeM/NucH family extracellular endonuclease [Lysobacter cavernae]|uniref:ExeM/NucH family extracellular endonuclease n=1 Tax=Lysobacter cavernae TaxID=1685901 RepID=A0ABV7RN49_9GAMM